jgi:NAD/NADP transhydrogenase alpha subunit
MSRAIRKRLIDRSVVFQFFDLAAACKVPSAEMFVGGAGDTSLAAIGAASSLGANWVWMAVMPRVR